MSRWEAAATSASPGDLLLLILVSSSFSFTMLFLDLNLRNNPPPLPLFLDAAAALSSPKPGLTGTSQTASASTHVSLSAVYRPAATRDDLLAEKSSASEGFADEDVDFSRLLDSPFFLKGAMADESYDYEET